MILHFTLNKMKKLLQIYFLFTSPPLQRYISIYEEPIVLGIQVARWGCSLYLLIHYPTLFSRFFSLSYDPLDMLSLCYHFSCSVAILMAPVLCPFCLPCSRGFAPHHAYSFCLLCFCLCSLAVLLSHTSQFFSLLLSPDASFFCLPRAAFPGEVKSN